MSVRMIEQKDDPGTFDIEVDGRIAGYATKKRDRFVIESASPSNEWEMPVTFLDLGGDDPEDVAAWVEDHADDFDE